MSHMIADVRINYAILGADGFDISATDFEKLFLGLIPITAYVVTYGYLVTPIVEKNHYHEITKIYLKFAEEIKLSYL